MTNKNRALGNGLENRVVVRSKRRRLWAKRQPGSGVYRDFPNDVVVENLLCECKVRSSLPSLSEMFMWLAGVMTNARRQGFSGAFLTFNTKGSRKPVVMLEMDLFLDILADLKDDSVFINSRNGEYPLDKTENR